MKKNRFKTNDLSQVFGFDQEEANWKIIPEMPVTTQTSDDAITASGIIPMHNKEDTIFTPVVNQ